MDENIYSEIITIAWLFCNTNRNILQLTQVADVNLSLLDVSFYLFNKEARIHSSYPYSDELSMDEF